MTIKNIAKWVDQLTVEYNRATDNKKRRLKNVTGHPSYHLHKIMLGLAKTIKENNFEEINKSKKEYTKKFIVQRINILANKQLYHYKTCKFCFIEQFFSSLRNLVTLGSFHSSAYLAKKMTDPLMNEFKQKGHEKKVFKMVDIQDTPPQEKPAIIEKKEHPKEKIVKKEIDHDVEQVNQLSLKEKVFHDIQEFWSTKDLSVEYIDEMWRMLLQKAVIKSYEKDKEDPSLFTIHLNSALKGQYKAFTFHLRDTVKFTLLEDGNKKIMEFDPSKKMGIMGPIKTKLNKIVLQDTPKENPEGCHSTFCIHGPIYKGEHTMPAYDALDYLKGIVWE